MVEFSPVKDTDLAAILEIYNHNPEFDRDISQREAV